MHTAWENIQHAVKSCLDLNAKCTVDKMHQKHWRKMWDKGSWREFWASTTVHGATIQSCMDGKFQRNDFTFTHNRQLLLNGILKCINWPQNNRWLVVRKSTKITILRTFQTTLYTHAHKEEQTVSVVGQTKLNKTETVYKVIVSRVKHEWR